jgi:hydroxymethylbilane synthase
VTPLRLGTRGSRLAHAQAGLAAGALRAAGLGPVAIVPISTAGDRDRRSAFSELGARGVFSKELEEALAEGRIDVAVHSAKDLTTDETPGLALAAVLPRADPRDAWCGPHASLAAVPVGARVGTASMRRGAQLRALRPDLVVESLRGNVDTRLRKRLERGLDGVVLAACGLDRLGLAAEIGFRVEPEEMLPETGQGFVALQTRATEAEAVAAVGEPEGARVLLAERSCAALLGGGCRAPVATHAVTLADGRLWLRAWLALPDGSLVVSADAHGDDPVLLAGEVAGLALGRGGEAIVAAVRA